MVITRSGAVAAPAPVEVAPAVAAPAVAASSGGVGGDDGSIQGPKGPSLRERLVGIKNAVVNFLTVSVPNALRKAKDVVGNLLSRAKSAVIALFSKKPTGPVRKPGPDGTTEVTTAGGMELRPRKSVNYKQ